MVAFKRIIMLINFAYLSLFLLLSGGLLVWSTPRRLFRKLLAAKKSPRNNEQAQSFLDQVLARPVEVPESLDWREAGNRVTQVKDQGLCGSCWAFATTGALEGQLVERNFSSSLIGLSEQNLVDCTNRNQGCEGGTMAEAMIAIRSQMGLDRADCYPYEGVDGECRFEPSWVAIVDSGAAYLSEGDEQELMVVVAKYGPVAISVDSSDHSFVHYKSGVYHGQSCSSDPSEANHALLVVGYGSDPLSGQDFWIVKNSWSAGWGEEGFIRMARNRDNNCGIASSAIIPTF